MIYLITNTINNKQYVGKTARTLEKRWYFHLNDVKYGSQRYFHRAIRKYGSNNFTLEVLEECSPEQDSERECYWIATLAPEYNMTEGGDGGWINDQTGKHWKVSVQGRENMRRSRQKNKKNYIKAHQELIPKISGGNNYQSTHYIHTPWGMFETYTAALKQAKKLRSLGRNDVVTDKGTLRKYCESDIILNKEGRRTFPEWRGKCTTEIGFYKEKKNNGSS